MVQLYVLDIRTLPDPAEHPEILEFIGDQRKEKVMKYRQADGRKRSLGAGILLGEILQRFGVSPGKIRIREGGKPEADGIFFNLSHSGELVICAVGDKEVGCDVEKIAKAPKRIAERFFHPGEKAYLKACGEERQNGEFYRLWTMKESYIKMTGEGMRLSLDRIEFVLGTEKVRVRRDGELISCHIREYDVPGYKISVCSWEEDFVDYIEFAKSRYNGCLLSKEGSLW